MEVYTSVGRPQDEHFTKEHNVTSYTADVTLQIAYKCDSNEIIYFSSQMDYTKGDSHFS